MTDEVEEVIEEVVDSTPTDEEKLEAVSVKEGDEPNTDDDPSTPADDDAGAHRSKSAERRIGQLTRNYRKEQRERLALQVEVEALKKRVGPEPLPPRPNRDNFDSDEDYEDELFEWRDNVKQTKSPTKDTSTATEQMEITASPEVQAFEEEIEGLDDPDAYDTVMVKDWPCNKATTDFIMTSDSRAELAYHLATNPDLAKEIFSLSPTLAARRLTKVEADLASNIKPGARNSNAPPPPLSTGKPGGAKGVIDPDKLSTKQWVAQRRAGKI